MTEQWFDKKSCIEMLQVLIVNDKSFISQFLYDSIIFHLKEVKQ